MLLLYYFLEGVVLLNTPRMMNEGGFHVEGLLQKPRDD